MANGIIYKIENPTGKIYIGKTIDFSSRMSAYRTLNCKDQKAIYNSLKKYGFNSHIIDIIYQGPICTLSEKEIEYIHEYKSFKLDNINGLNLTRGGEGTLGRKDNKETINKRAQKLAGSTRSNETKRLMSASAKKTPSNFTGRKHSEETLRKMSIKKEGKTQSKYTVTLKLQTTKQNRLKKFGSILQISPFGDIIKEWEPSFTLIAKELGCDPTTIRKAVNSNGKDIRLGYKWRYNKK